MVPAGATSPGRVSATPERPLPRDAYDVVVLGGGLMGAAVAARLRRELPGRSLLLVEAGGLPNEDGATVASPGLLPPAVDGGDEGRAWVLAWIAEALGPQADGLKAGWLELAPGAPQGAAPDARPLREVLDAAEAATVAALTGLDGSVSARRLAGGYLSAEALALALARRAVREGADLALNAEARPQSARRLALARLAADRRMQVGVRARQLVSAGTVVVACGAASAAVAEAGLDRPVRLSTAQLQFPRVRLASGEGAPRLPAVSLAGWVWRPAPGGALLVPPPPPPDPEGFQVRGGRLLGVPVGLRRELVERLLDTPELEPLVSSGRLDLGKSARTVRGARFSLPLGGRALAEPLGQEWWLLAGGARGLADDLAAAARLAARVAGAPPPWRR